MVIDRGHRAMRGTFTALVTPFDHNDIDWRALEALVDRQVAAGVDGVVPCGSTGESAALTFDEHVAVIEAVVRRVAGRCTVLAGTGSSSTAEAVEMTRRAADAGADGALIVTPCYSRPTQEGMFRHYAAIADAVDLPIVLYNVPKRCGVDLANETILRLSAAYRHVVAVKDASGGVDRVTELVTRSDLAVLSGDDSSTLSLMALGAAGVVSVIANLVPSWVKQLVDAAAAGDLARARSWHARTCALADRIGRLGPNPVPVKTAMAMMGLVRADFRLPLCPLSDARKREIEETLSHHELL